MITPDESKVKSVPHVSMEEEEAFLTVFLIKKSKALFKAGRWVLYKPRDRSHKEEIVRVLLDSGWGARVNYCGDIVIYREPFE
jgi:hypothetical protein